MPADVRTRGERSIVGTLTTRYFVVDYCSRRDNEDNKVNYYETGQENNIDKANQPTQPPETASAALWNPADNMPRERRPLPGFEHNIFWGGKRYRTSGEQIWKRQCSYTSCSTYLEQLALALSRGKGNDMFSQLQRYATAYQHAKRHYDDQGPPNTNVQGMMSPPSKTAIDGLLGQKVGHTPVATAQQGFAPYAGSSSANYYDQITSYNHQPDKHGAGGQSFSQLGQLFPWQQMGSGDAKIQYENEKEDAYYMKSDQKKRKLGRKKSCQYTGVRRRQWGTYAAEIRNPKSGSREWLGTFETAEEAAVVYDARLRQIKGPSASRANFPELDQSGPMIPREICPHGQSSAERETIQIPCNWMDQILQHKQKVQKLQNS